jgi:glutathione peroxidase
MAIYDAKIHDLDGDDADLHDYEGKTVLLVNVASACGLTPQYAGLQKLHEEFGGKGFEVLGFPCNQFMGQEPGTADEIKAFCETNYNVSFPLFEKIEVNGDGRHALYEQLVTAPDSADGHTGDIRWNFEKFLVGPSGEIVGRFSPAVEPEDASIVDAIKAHLPG